MQLNASLYERQRNFVEYGVLRKTLNQLINNSLCRADLAAGSQRLPAVIIVSCRRDMPSAFAVCSFTRRQSPNNASRIADPAAICAATSFKPRAAANSKARLENSLAFRSRPENAADSACQFCATYSSSLPFVHSICCCIAAASPRTKAIR